MYSAVLMLALTAGSETADHGRNRCHSACSMSSCGGLVSGCASSCHARGGLFANRCHGCSTSCGHAVHHAPACSASCSHGCHGGGLFARMRSRCSCPPSCAVYVAPCSGGAVGGVIIDKKPLPKEKGEEIKKPKGSVQSSAPATIVVSLPADARLTVDGAQTNSVSERRTLVTPNLEAGETYVYTLRAEIVRD